MKPELAKKELSRRILSLPQVSGVVLKERGGIPYLVVYLSEDNPEIHETIPKIICGIEVRVEVTGRIIAF